jgi:hypothetical protein
MFSPLLKGSFFALGIKDLFYCLRYDPLGPEYPILHISDLDSNHEIWQSFLEFWFVLFSA